VLLPFGSLRDPAREQIDLLRSQLLARFRRGHDIIGIFAGDAFDHLALGRFARHDCEIAGLGRLERVFLLIETQLGFALLVVRTVALETILRKDGPDLPVEINSRNRLVGGRR
jgi:hypothetical protein